MYIFCMNYEQQHWLLKGHCHPRDTLAATESYKYNGSMILFEMTTLAYRNGFFLIVYLPTDSRDGSGLKLERFRLTFSSSSLVSSNNIALISYGLLFL